MTSINAPGKFKELTISMATDDLPDPELPAIPIMLISGHGGQHLPFRPDILQSCGVDAVVTGIRWLVTKALE